MANPIIDPKFSTDSFISPSEIKALYDEIDRLFGNFKQFGKKTGIPNKNLTYSVPPKDYKSKDYNTLLGVPNLKITGYTGDNSVRAFTLMNPEASDTVFMNRDSDTPSKGADSNYIKTLLHELNHVYTKKGFKDRNKYVEHFDKQVGDTSGKKRIDFMLNLFKHGNYIAKKYNDPSTYYFNPNVLKDNPDLNPIELFEEQMSSLNAIQDRMRKNNPAFNITDDTNLKEVFSNPEIIKAFDAFSGLRRTRFDAKDLRPYTVDK